MVILRCLEGWLYIIFRQIVGLVFERVFTGLALLADAEIHVVPLFALFTNLGKVGEVCLCISSSVS